MLEIKDVKKKFVRYTKNKKKEESEKPLLSNIEFWFED